MANLVRQENDNVNVNDNQAPRCMFFNDDVNVNDNYYPALASSCGSDG